MEVLNLISYLILVLFPLCKGFFLDSIFKTTTTRQPFVYQPGVLDPAAALFCPKHLNRTKTLMYNTYTRHCFTINIAKTAKWYAAKSSCESLGGYLARPREFSDNMFIGFRARGALHYRYKHIWIGLSDIEKEGDYRWTNGDSLNYTNWGAREPTGIPWQNCVAYDRDTDKWDNKDCSLKYGWICQFDHEAKPVTTPIPTSKSSTHASTTPRSKHTSKPTTVKPASTTPVPTTETPSTTKPSTVTPSPTSASTTPSSTPRVSTTHTPSTTPLSSPTTHKIHVPSTMKPITGTHRFPGYEIIG